MGEAVRKLRDNEKLFAFLDDVYVVCTPHRVDAVLAILAQELQHHAQIDLHQGKQSVEQRRSGP